MHTRCAIRDTECQLMALANSCCTATIHAHRGSPPLTNTILCAKMKIMLSQGGVRMYSSADAKCFLSLVRCALRDEEPGEIPSDVNLTSVFSLAKMHNLCELISYSLPKAKPTPAPELLEALRKIKHAGIAQQIHQDVELDTIKAGFEKNGIDFVLLKGGVIKDLYPSPDMRSMCDLDILIRPDKMAMAKEIMLTQLGYKAENIVEGEHDLGFGKPPFINIELHHAITDRLGNREAYEYYKDAWELAIPKSEGAHEHIFSKEDFYIHHIEHLAKHYRYGGCGVRPFCDIYVFLRAHGDTIKWDYIYEILKRIRLFDFEAHIRALALKWLDNGEGDEVSDAIEEYVLHGGSFGLAEDKQLTTVARLHTKNGKIKRFGYFFKKIFLPYRPMTVGYPVLKKAPILLPFCWIHRIFNRLLFKRDRVKAQLEITADDSKVLTLVKHLNSIGLE